MTDTPDPVRPSGRAEEYNVITGPVTAKPVEELLAWSAEMRRTSPVLFDEQHGVWHVFGYAECKQALHDVASFSSAAPVEEGASLFVEGNFALMNPPQHRQLRQIVGHAFTPRFVEGLAVGIEATVTELLDELAGRPVIDFVNEFASPLAIRVVSAMFGLPATDFAMMREISDGLLGVGREQLRITDDQATGLNMIKQQLDDYLRAHITTRRRTATDDLTSLLVASTADGRRLSDPEIAGVMELILLGGHITTTSLLTSALLCLDGVPELAGSLRGDHSLIPGAVEEMSRFLPPFSRVPRVTAKPVRLGAEEIPAGQVVIIWLASANQDESVFERPRVLDIHRRPNPHLAFGHGIHFCLGAPLARLEVRIALAALLNRFRTFQVDRSVPITSYDPAGGIIALHRLPVTLVP